MTRKEIRPVPLTQCGPTEGENFEYHWTGEYVQAHLLSDVGKKRKRNEDSCVLCVPEDSALNAERGLLFAVADGMGGASAGDFASRLALNVLIDEYYHKPAGPIPERMRAAIEEANNCIFEESEINPERHGMGTTASVVVVNGDCAYVAQVGDSRVYVLRKKEVIFQITDDHSLVAEQVRNGYLSAEEARNHSLKNLITRAVGIKGTVKVDLFGFRLQDQDTLLICSDGLSNLVKDEEIAEVMSMDNLQAAARILIGRALTEGGSDNITAVLLRVIQPPTPGQFDQGIDEVFIPRPGLFGKVMKLFKRS